MRSLADSTGLLRQSPPELGASLQAEGRRVLFFDKQGVKAGQLRVAISQVGEPLTVSEIYIVVVHTTDEQIVYRLGAEDWSRLPRVDRLYRLCRLDRLMRVVDAVPLRLSSSSASICETMDVEEADVAPPPQCLPSLPILWPHRRRHPTITTGRSGLLFYVGAVLDYALLEQPPLANAPNSLRQDWLTWLESNYAYRGADEHYDEMLYHLMLAASVATVSPQLIYGHLDWPLAQEILNLSVFLFRHQLHDSDDNLAALESAFRGHAHWIAQESYSGWHHPWTDYMLTDGVLWRQSGRQITLSMLWLLETPTLTSSQYRTENGGVFTVSVAHFLEHLAPYLYRQVLCDTLHYLRYTALYGRHDNAWHGHPGDVERVWLHETLRDVMPELVTALKDWRGMESFNERRAQNHSSPVMRAMVQYWQSQDTRQPRGSQSFGSHKAATVITDIEDLGTAVPPCMRRALRQSWCKNLDRLNLIKYLFDMGYGREQVVTFMCRQSEKREDVATIGSEYDACVRRQQTDDRRQGKSCATIINLGAVPGNVLRCVYEEEKNGEKRREKHTEHEQLVFTSQCACEAGTTRRIYSPLDYVKIKLSK